MAAASCVCWLLRGRVTVRVRACVLCAGSDVWRELSDEVTPVVVSAELDAINRRPKAPVALPDFAAPPSESKS